MEQSEASQLIPAEPSARTALEEKSMSEQKSYDRLHLARRLCFAISPPNSHEGCLCEKGDTLGAPQRRLYPFQGPAARERKFAEAKGPISKFGVKLGEVSLDLPACSSK